MSPFEVKDSSSVPQSCSDRSLSEKWKKNEIPLIMDAAENMMWAIARLSA